MDPMTVSMIAGRMQGNAMGQQPQPANPQQQQPPTAYQPTGVPGNYTILCGNLKSCVVTLNESANLLNQQGADKTALANQIYKAAYDINKVCDQLEKEAVGAGQQQQ